MNQPRLGRLLLCMVLIAAPAIVATPANSNEPRARKNPVFNLQEIEVPPVALVRAAPEYPPELRAQRVSAKVVVEFIIDRQGNVAVTAIFSSTDARFDAPSLDAVKKWKFKPALIKGEPVNCRVAQQLNFSPD